MSEREKILTKKIMDYIQGYLRNPSAYDVPPSFDTLTFKFRKNFNPKEIRLKIWELIDEGILYYYSFHGYLSLAPSYTEKFKSSFEEE